MFMAWGELESVRSALRQAETRVNEAELRLKDALDDKQQVIREISAQGNRIAESALGEEKARSALTAVSSDAKAVEKRLGALKARLAKSQKQLRALRKENAALSTVKAELAVLTGELDETRAMLEQTQAEMERYRALAEPYGARPQSTRQPGQ
jgi:chromosome segregation ATPase